MNEIENELKKLQPLAPSAGLFERIAADLENVVAEEKIIRPNWFRANWLSLGVGLAAAAVVLIFANPQWEFRQASRPRVAANSMTPPPAVPAPVDSYVPAGATQVVYHRQDEGLFFRAGSNDPVRRVRSRTRETLQWRNPSTGASLRVTYPSEQVELIPVSGQ